jgi:hypothetical protein
MIEVILVLGMACTEGAPHCHIDADASEIPVFTWDNCVRLRDNLPGELMLAIPGLIVEARCKKVERVKPKEETK